MVFFHSIDTFFLKLTSSGTQLCQNELWILITQDATETDMNETFESVDFSVYVQIYNSIYWFMLFSLYSYLY